MTPLARRLIRAVLAWCPLGEHRDDLADDVAELFEARRRTRGWIYAGWRLSADVASLARPGRLRLPDLMPAEPPARGSAGWFRDLRYGLRLFARHPAVIGATVGGLSLAIAVCTTVFTLLNATLLRPYGMADPSSVVRVQMLVADGMANQWPYHAFASMRERATHARLEAVAQERVRFALSSDETANRTDSVAFVSGSYLSTLGAHAVRGRVLQPGDDQPGAPPVAVVNHSVWTGRLQSDPAIVGRTVWLSGSPVTIVGVVEASFTGPTDTPPALWAPFGSYGAIQRDRPIDRSSVLAVGVLARIGERVDRAVAAGELSAIAAALPDLGVRNESGAVDPVTGVQFDAAASPMSGPDAAGAIVVIGAILVIVGLVLALACLNVANLMLAGAAARSREIAVRMALGASQGRILRQLLTESLLMGMIAGGAGLLLSLWLVPVVASLTSLPETHDVRPDRAVFLFAAATALISGLGAGLAPARHAAGDDLIGVIKSQGTQLSGPPKAARLRRWFIGFQAAGSILLLVTAALFLRGALHVTRVDVGFEGDRLATVAATFPRTGDRVTAVAYWETALERARAIPSVEGASLVLYPPFGGATSVRTLGSGSSTYRIYENRADASYFDTAGFRLLRGRGFAPAEGTTDAPVAVVSESIVRDFLPGVEPIGASLAAISDDLSHVTVVGVVAEALTARVRGRGNGTIYRPLSPATLGDARLVVRAPFPPAIVRDLEKALLAVDPRVRLVTGIVGDDVARYKSEPKVLAGMAIGVAGLALVLSVLGILGVTAVVVSQRMWEMQVRRALGASAPDVMRLLVRESLMPVGIGLFAGLAVALAAARVLAPALSGVSPYDPAAVLGAVLVLAGAAVAAVLVPALRAARANPASLLRSA